MIVKSRVDHKVSPFVFVKHYLKIFYHAIPSIKFKPDSNKTGFIFIVGCGHSGTTLVSAKLSNHSEVMGIGRETSAMVPGMNSLYGMRAIANEWAYFSEYNGNSCVLEKTPKHLYSYGAIQKVVPNNKFIVIVRNPLDNIASLYRRFDDLELSVNRWIYDNSEALKIKNNSNVLVVHYEKLTRNPEETFRALTNFLGLSYERQILDSNQSIYNKTHQIKNMRLRQEQVSRPVMANEGGWKKVFSDEQARKILSRVSGLAEQLGYSPDDLMSSNINSSAGSRHLNR